MSHIKTTYKKLKRELRSEITFDALVKYLQKIGYSVFYYSSNEGQALLQKYNLTDRVTDRVSEVNALTFVNDSAKIVFINDSIPINDMLHSITHELAHIVLGHLEGNPYTKDKRLNEMEAETLAYQLLYPKGR